MAAAWRDDVGYSSGEDDNSENIYSTEQTPQMVIEASLARLRLRAGYQEDSFVKLLSTSMLSRLALHIFKKWESTKDAIAAENKHPDMIAIITEELRRFASRRAIREEYETRNAAGSLAHDDLAEMRRRERSSNVPSPRRRSSRSFSLEDPALDIDIVQPVRFRSSPSESPMSPTKGIVDPEELRSFQRMEPVRVHRRRSSRTMEEEVEREERRRLRNLRRSTDSFESSTSPKKTPDSASDLEKSGEHTATSSDVSKDEAPQMPTPESSVSPEQSTTPSDELVTSIEENPSRPVVPQPEAKHRRTSEEKERHRKKTKQVIEKFSNRQLTSLKNIDITRTDVMEMLFQLSVTQDRLDWLLNGSKFRQNIEPDIDEASVFVFFDVLVEFRDKESAQNELSERPSEPVLPSIPSITEEPHRDPKNDA